MIIRLIRLVLIVLLLVALLVMMIAKTYIYNNLHYDDQRLKRTRRAGFREKQVRLPDRSVLCYAEGPKKGPPLLLLHDVGMCWEDFDAVLPDLAKNYHVFAVDRFGHGGSTQDSQLYSCVAEGEALLSFIEHVIGLPCFLAGHGTGGVLAAWMAANSPTWVKGLLLENPTFFRSTPTEMKKEDGCILWNDLCRPVHQFLHQGTESDYAIYYVKHGYRFQSYGGMRDRVVYWAEQYRKQHPAGPLKLRYIPYGHLHALYYLDRWDLAWGESLYTGRWLRKIRQDTLLKSITCPVALLKSTVRYDRGGVLCAANSVKDTERVEQLLPRGETVNCKCGHTVHAEKPRRFLTALDRLRIKC